MSCVNYEEGREEIGEEKKEIKKGILKAKFRLRYHWYHKKISTK
jgi:hypothetical protein